MLRRKFMTLTLSVLVVVGPASGAAAAEKIRVLLVGGRGHDWKGFHAAIAPVLHKTGDFEVTLTEKLDDLKAESIAKYSVVLFYGSGGDFTDPAQEKGLDDFVRGGGGLAGVHATDAFKKSDVYWRLLGGRFTTHGGGKFWLRIEDKEHPITKPMADFEIQDETYQNAYHPEFKLHSLGRIDRGPEQQSMVWVQECGQGRVFNTTLGHGQAAFDNPQFQRFVVRGLYWAAGREPKDPGVR
jgi:type 1 glutamine amidotransferase